MNSILSTLSPAQIAALSPAQIAALSVVPAPAVTSVPTTEPKRRGRPVGSKNAPKTPVATVPSTPVATQGLTADEQAMFRLLAAKIGMQIPEAAKKASPMVEIPGLSSPAVRQQVTAAADNVLRRFDKRSGKEVRDNREPIAVAWGLANPSLMAAARAEAKGLSGPEYKEKLNVACIAKGCPVAYYLR